MGLITYSFLVAFCICLVTADVYFHNPRGSNNRLNEKSAARTNANRLFDSQNNNRGGYNVGDATSDPAGNDENKQYQMKYFQSSASGSSYLTLEWTNQHGCGEGVHKQNCDIILQYMCQRENSGSNLDKFRDGVNTNEQEFTNPKADTESVEDLNERKKKDVKLNRGVQEPWEWYDACYRRERNQGLFTADQKLRKNKLGYSAAVYTRQNPNGNRRGYECPEERDYYPYWHPSPWKDIAVLTSNTRRCSEYKRWSHNVRPYGWCVTSRGAAATRWRDRAACEEHGHSWTLVSNHLDIADGYRTESACSQAGNVWGRPLFSTRPKCLVPLPEPDCRGAPWTRSNHLGNTLGGEASRYTWKLPYLPSEKTHKCVLRIRYNISTDDYDGYATDYRHNDNKILGKVSPVRQNPLVDGLRLAINTAQFGRTFQDRSHVFSLVPRPAAAEDAAIYNLNVRGKRGNIVQTYPAVEYDFMPARLEVRRGDLVHLQWTGSNTHQNGQPAGDGQAGDAGEGKSGTDRNNILEIPDASSNFPLPFEATRMWSGAEVVWAGRGKLRTAEALALDVATAGYTKMKSPTLDDCPASYYGPLVRFAKGTFHFMSSRNNNFSNRSQKGKLIVR